MTTAIDIITAYQQGSAIKVAVMGNSVGCGYYATNWENIQMTPGDDPRGVNKLTPYSQADTSIGSWANQLKAMLQSANPTSVVMNESGNAYDAGNMLGGTLGGYDLIDTVAYIISLGPDIVFVPLQINDSFRMSTEQYQIYLDEITQRFLAAGVVPVLVKENETAYGLSAFIAVVGTVAAARNVPVLDTNAPFRDAFTAAGGWAQSGLMYDENHPNQAGENLIFAQYEAWFNEAAPYTLTFELQDGAGNPLTLQDGAGNPLTLRQ
jgi:lysophospholipase L1-like esterase